MYIFYAYNKREIYMITVVGGIKGGGGKTTLATNLCVMRTAESKKVLLVDADEQRTASDWAGHREGSGIPTNWITVKLSGNSIHTEIKKMLQQYEIDDVIIDVGGRDTVSQRAAFAIAHKCILPFKPKSFDMWTLNAVRTLVAEARAFNPTLLAYCVINQADARGIDNEDARDMIEDVSELICLPSFIGYRKAFANAAAEGLGVIELKKPDLKAVEEIQKLYFHVYNT
jgi:chromosome partitioning protein